jgi:hypothetical protein
MAAASAAIAPQQPPLRAVGETRHHEGVAHTQVRKRCL